MEPLTVSKDTRGRVAQAVWLSFLVPGAGHWLTAGHRKWAVIWFALCQVLLFLGFFLAEATQLNYRTLQIPAREQGFGFFVLIPEVVNFVPTLLAGALFTNPENMGAHPELVPLRHIGFLLSGISGVLAAFVPAHAAGLILAGAHPLPSDRNVHPTAPKGRYVNPGVAAFATLVLPGAGHWLSGRRFKAGLFGVSILGLFFLGMLLGDFADFERQRHPYYWAGQMFIGPIGWLVALLAHPLQFSKVLPYQDSGLLFTTCAGFFVVIAALDAYFRAEQDWLRCLNPRQNKSESKTSDSTSTSQPEMTSAAPTVTGS